MDFAAFDKKYFAQYPFLYEYLNKFFGCVLEVGTGYGTVAQYLAEKCESYTGLDIAEGPLKILKERGLDNEQGNVLSLPYPDNHFDGVVSIGCIHHTGNMQKAAHELIRVLKPGGRLLVMVYNAEGKKAVDRNTQGEDAPHTDYATVAEAQALFALLPSVTICERNGAYRDIYIEAVK